MRETTRQTITLDDLRARRDEILRLAEQHGAYNVRVFGSVARGEATPDSDVDLLITTREGVSVFDLVGLWLDLQEMLGREVSLITDDENPRHERFMRRVLKDAVPL
jgi:predicted nucleotidyltransferase